MMLPFLYSSLIVFWNSLFIFLDAESGVSFAKARDEEEACA